jgi:hypothetical protein
VFLIQPEGVIVRETFGQTFAEIQGLVDVPLIDRTHLRL